ncbi:MAG: polysaccharide pyruvyl transferase family protein [Acetobacter sp.]|nr:polysaccharide pyruvyl transferase family protein [Bacteroides sp.]MCM1341556.1 polysaccharide pyruvyl transferase family protein [Acetobacter sp.]MCM1433633.1 polysaccharide pyruvyl transferase family protein [Clostridiales bacterium]
MEIKIVTITGESNYGNSLQNYAVKTVLENLNNNVETIKTEYEPNFKKINITNIKNFVKIILKRSNYLQILRAVKFKKFSNKNLNKSKFVCRESKPELNSKCDLLVFGSDQIWNFTWGGRICNNINYYTGDFAYDIPKIAYSASIGSDYIPEKYQETFVNNISKFKYISVREHRAQNIITELLDIKAEVTVDPTLMLDKSDWMKIAKKPKYIKKNDKFILTYFLGTKNEEYYDYIDSIAKEKNLRIIKLDMERLDYNSIENPKCFVTDPSEFIWLIANCEIVFTDSFHGSVFSILMQRPFRCFNRKDNGVESMSSRMDTLFGMLNITDWCIGNINENIEHVFYKDYSNTQCILERERKFALNYLRRALNSDENRKK